MGQIELDMNERWKGVKLDYLWNVEMILCFISLTSALPLCSLNVIDFRLIGNGENPEGMMLSMNIFQRNSNYFD